MRKISIFILITFGVLITFNACSKKDTYADKLKKERKAINRFIAQNGISVFNELSKDKPIVFDENAYFKDPNTGVYFHIIDYGTGDPIKERDEISLRYDTVNVFLIGNDTIMKGNDYNNNIEDIKFMYGDLNDYLETNAYSLGYYYKSAGCTIPIKYGLKDKGRVRLIIPFSSGSTGQQYYNEPLYINELTYRIIN